MYDALTLAAVVDELNDTILDGRIQRVLLLDRLTFGLEVYAGRRCHLLLSADNRDARLHLVAAGSRLTGDAAQVTPLLLLLRKYARGGRIVRVYQPDQLERVVLLRIAKFFAAHDDAAGAAERDDLDDTSADAGDEPVDGDLVETTLAVEIMGRHSNLILVGADGRIIDSAKRVPPHLSRVRPVLPRGPYRPVPPQEKADPRTIDGTGLARLLAAAPDTALHSVLVNGLRGLSPQVAREVAFRATGAAGSTAGAVAGREAALRRVLDELYAPLRTGAWTPRLYRRDEQAVAFSPFSLGHLRALQEERCDTISVAAERFFAATQHVQAHAQRKEALASQIRQEHERVMARLRSLEQQAVRAAEAERWRRWGEAIYAYAWSLAPGQRELACDDGVTVPLDPDRTPSENAQIYFERYRKARIATANLPELVAAGQTTLRYLDQLLTLLGLAERYEEIVALDREWQAWRAGQYQGRETADGAQAGQQRSKAAGGHKPKQQPGAARPRPLRARGGHQIFVGRTGAQNDAVTFDIAGPNDTWLHGRGMPGAHVIVKWARGELDDAVLRAAAELAAHYSGNRTAGHVEVDYAARRDVRKIKGIGPGMVTYRNERTVRVVPCSEDELRRQGILE